MEEMIFNRPNIARIDIDWSREGKPQSYVIRNLDTVCLMENNGLKNMVSIVSNSGGFHVPLDTHFHIDVVYLDEEPKKSKGG